MSSCKVLFLVCDDTYFLSHRLTLARYVQKKGCEVVVACSNTGQFHQIERAGFRVIDLQYDRTTKLADLKLFFKLRGIIKQEQPDIIHNIALRMVFVSMLSQRSIRGGRKIGAMNSIMGLGHLFAHDSLKIKLLRFGVVRVLAWLFKADNRVIVQNRDDYQVLVAHIRVPENKMALIKGSGVNMDLFPVNHKKVDSDKPWNICMLSRLLETKGVREYFMAARILAKQGVSNVLFNLYGAPYPANPSSINESVVNKWQEEDDNFYWHGHVEDVPAIYQDADIAVLPSSYREGLPKSLIEASASSLPIITTDTPGCREICHHRVNGMLVPVRDAQSIAEAILYFVNNPDKIAEMGLAGRQLVEREFTDSIVHEKTWQVYKSVMQNDS